MAKRKPLEGIEALMFVLGGGLGILLAKQNYPWWTIFIIIIVAGMILGNLAEYLRNKNIK